jgi:hypothetical protein
MQAADELEGEGTAENGDAGEQQAEKGGAGETVMTLQRDAGIQKHALVLGPGKPFRTGI